MEKKLWVRWRESGGWTCCLGGGVTNTEKKSNRGSSRSQAPCTNDACTMRCGGLPHISVCVSSKKQLKGFTAMQLHPRAGHHAALTSPPRRAKQARRDHHPHPCSCVVLIVVIIRMPCVFFCSSGKQASHKSSKMDQRQQFSKAAAAEVGLRDSRKVCVPAGSLGDAGNRPKRKYLETHCRTSAA